MSSPDSLPASLPDSPSPSPSASPALPSVATLRAALSKVADPEIGANIVDLGLVYAIRADATGVSDDLTMTSPACPMGGLIVDDARAELQRLLPPETPVEINVVWEPAWSPALMSPECRARLGWED